VVVRKEDPDDYHQGAQTRLASVTFPFPDERGVPKLAACDRMSTCPNSYFSPPSIGIREVFLIKLYSIGKHSIAL
jgi:hypothetical protein